MKTIVVLMAFISSMAMAQTRCDLNFKVTQLCAQIDWIYGPFLDQNNSLTISVNKNDAVKSIKVIPWMVMSEGHEHGSRPVKMSVTSELEYRIENAYFMGGMMGDWFLKVQLLDTNGKLLEEAKAPISFKN